MIPAYKYETWRSEPRSIDRLKIAELKCALKCVGECISGRNKAELKVRLLAAYEKYPATTTIQRIFRGFLVLKSERLRGPGYKDRAKCVNHTDFRTMNSVDEIPRESFFSYEDANGFVYGFSLFSLMSMFQHNRRQFKNPYNREDIPVEIICRIFSLYKKVEILYPLVFFNERVDRCGEDIDLSQINVLGSSSREEEDLVLTQDVDMDIDEYNSDEIVWHRAVAVFENIRELVGGEIDYRWFLNLSSAECDRFFHYYQVWWERSNPMTDQQKISISGVENPFELIDILSRNREDEGAFLLACLELIEIMTYNGVDDSCRRIGALQVMIALTLVSMPARIARRDLFELI